jgi:hypothetical protein
VTGKYISDKSKPIETIGVTWPACMFREFNLVGCSNIDIIDYTLCLMQLSVVRNLILVEFSD